MNSVSVRNGKHFHGKFAALAIRLGLAKDPEEVEAKPSEAIEPEKAEKKARKPAKKSKK